MKLNNAIKLIELERNKKAWNVSILFLFLGYAASSLFLSLFVWFLMPYIVALPAAFAIVLLLDGLMNKKDAVKKAEKRVLAFRNTTYRFQEQEVQRHIDDLLVIKNTSLFKHAMFCTVIARWNQARNEYKAALKGAAE